MCCSLFQASPENFYEDRITPYLNKVTQNSDHLLDAVFQKTEYKSAEKLQPTNEMNPDGEVQKLVCFSESSDYMTNLAQINRSSNLFLLTTVITGVVSGILFVSQGLSVIPIVVGVASVIFLGLGMWKAYVVHRALKEIKFSHEERMKEIYVRLCTPWIDVGIGVGTVDGRCERCLGGKKSEMDINDKMYFNQWFDKNSERLTVPFCRRVTVEGEKAIKNAIKKAWDNQSFAANDREVYKAIVKQLTPKSYESEND